MRTQPGRRALTALAAITMLGMLGGTAGAQSSPVQLAFGYDCGDRFQIRNDGAGTVDVEYGVAGADRTRARINARESVTITSQSNDAMELWVNGRRVSTEQKGNRACAASTQDVVVRPLNSGDYANTSAGDNVTYTVQPANTVYVAAPATSYYPSYYPYYDPYYYGYGYVGRGYGFGYYGYRAPILSLSVPFGSGYYGGRTTYVHTAPRGGSVGHGVGRVGVRR